MPLSNSSLHYQILKHFVEFGHAPCPSDLAFALDAPIERVAEGLIELQEYHGVVLHPGTSDIWAAHPFSASPTSFWVENGRGGWWANCAWCAMGVVTLVGGTAMVTTTLGAESKQVTFRVVDGALESNDLFVHFPVPMARAWDNVVYTCSLQLLFESEDVIADWCARHRVPRGNIQPLARVLEFAKVWYGQHLNPNWTKWSAAQAAAVFEQFGLTGPTWQLPVASGRF